jgi:hypothetical protein
MNKVVAVHAKAKHQDVQERKAQLLRQGEFYRVGVVHAKAQLKHAASPQAMFHSVIDHATWALRSRMDGLLRPAGMNVASLMPYAISVLGFIRRRRLGKPALGVSLLLAGLGWYFQHRQAQQLTE